ncbi:hypothetical protein DEA8626_02098 [Defluviimonas aquaemixtae]|uniref:YjiS-like domain-containing protein n=1 Tax=Albidovulum aquaemixtae TaxID=1542388 RepID=A0A2R8B7F9_9RHOB|nr:DUF1127 domain-containing protein [Defluviimonas aquaemixtae]SPH18558.1 hypothetical protein DEA8626_02098 [Defluviimonas aquaemixtae]
MAYTVSHSLPRPRRTGLVARFRDMVEIRRQRRALLDLNAHLLKDIGLSAQEAQEESERPVWDVPDHWRR